MRVEFRAFLPYIYRGSEMIYPAWRGGVCGVGTLAFLENCECVKKYCEASAHTVLCYRNIRSTILKGLKRMSNTRKMLHELIDKLTENEVTFLIEFLKRILHLD